MRLLRVGVAAALIGAVAACSAISERFANLSQGEGDGANAAELASATSLDAPPTPVVFDEPTIGDMFLDRCLRRGSGCGEPAADAFCQRQGYETAESFAEGYPGQRGPTMKIGDRTRCTHRCESFDQVVCVNRLERTYVNPMLRDFPLDNCRSFGRNCGLPAATAFCKSEGFKRAVQFGVYRDGVFTRTELLRGSQPTCAGEHCGAFRFIRCTPF